MDNLAYGPCSALPKEHARKRRAFWSLEALRTPPTGRLALPQVQDPSQVLGASDLVDRIKGKSGPFVVWGSEVWPELLFKAWAIDALIGAGIDKRDVALVEPPEREAVSWQPLQRLARLAGSARVVSRKTVDAYIRFWRSFCDSSPRTLIDAVGRVSAFPSVEALLPYVNLIPRRAGAVLQLSQFDQELLGRLTDKEWRGRAEIFGNHALSSRLVEYGDLAECRVWHWSQFRRGSFVQAKLEPRKGVLDVLYCLTPRGVDLLQRGFAGRPSAPRLQVGGIRPYGARPLWVNAWQSGGWRLQELKG